MTEQSGLTGLGAEFDAAYRAVFSAYHRRDQPRSALPSASLAVLTHLAMAGPLTIGELSGHLTRAQSVVSEIVDHLERDGLLEREPDPADRRRHLVWLTDLGRARLTSESQVLDVGHLDAALTNIADAQGLIDAMHQLAACARPPRTRPRPATAPRDESPRTKEKS